MVDRIEPTHEAGDFSLKRSKKRKAEQKDEQQKKKRKEDKQLKKTTMTTNMNEFSLKRSKKRKEEHNDEQQKKKRKEDKQPQKKTITTNMNDFSPKRSKKRKEEQKDEQQKKKRKEGKQLKKTTMTTNINDFNLKKRKKMRTTHKKDFSLKPHVWTTNNMYLDDDLVVTQILTRLPAKSLMRFKSVCKSWKSIIEQDSHFINLHHTHSQARPQLLTIVFDRTNTYRERRGCFDILSADLDCDGDVRRVTIRSSAITLRSPSPNIKVVGPVGGLLCFADLANFDVMIYNVSTRQAVTPWIRSSVSLKKLPFFKPVCEFGFDLDTGEHKVIFVWHHPTESSKPFCPPACCEVLTVGVDASWRIIDTLPPPTCNFSFSYQSTCANGSVYWTIQNRSILEFDMGSEKFRTIRIPEFIERGKLIELDGCLTILPFHRTGARKVTMWTFHDRNKKRCNGTTSNTSEGEEWTAFTFEQPACKYRWSNWNTILHPIPGKDQIILEAYTPAQRFSKNVKIAQFLCYNKINNTFSEFRISGIPPSLSVAFETCSKLFVEGLFHAAQKKPVKNPNKSCNYKKEDFAE